MLGLLAPLAIKGIKAIGLHVLPHLATKIPLLAKIPGVSALSGLSTPLQAIPGGIRLGFILGFASAGFLFSPKFHQGIEDILGAIKDAIL